MKRRTAHYLHRSYVVVMAFLLVAVLALFSIVVPRFEVLFADFGIDLPWPTMVVIRASRFVRANILLLALLVAALIGLLWTALDQLDRPGKRKADLDL